MDDMLELAVKERRLELITQRVGFALWQVQEFEGVAATYFGLVTQARKGMGLTEGTTFLEAAQARTLGATFHHIKRAGLLSADLEARFGKLIVERNWLVHDSRRDSRSAVHNDTSMERLVARLDAIAEVSLALLIELGGVAEQFARQNSVSAEYIRKKAAEFLAEWHDS